MKKEQRRKTHLLPSRAPKKTGKRGPRPQADYELKEAKAPKQMTFIEDAAIQEIEDAATDYEAIRDRRMALTKQEVAAKDLVREAMKKHDKMLYRRDGLEIERKPGEEDVKVRRIKEEE